MALTKLQRYLRRYNVFPDEFTQGGFDGFVDMVTDDLKDRLTYRGFTDTELREIATVIVQSGIGSFEVLLTDGLRAAKNIRRTKKMGNGEGTEKKETKKD